MQSLLIQVLLGFLISTLLKIRVDINTVQSIHILFVMIHCNLPDCLTRLFEIHLSNFIYTLG